MRLDSNLLLKVIQGSAFCHLYIFLRTNFFPRSYIITCTMFSLTAFSASIKYRSAFLKKICLNIQAIHFIVIHIPRNQGSCTVSLNGR